MWDSGFREEAVQWETCLLWRDLEVVQWNLEGWNSTAVDSFSLSSGRNHFLFFPGFCENKKVLEHKDQKQNWVGQSQLLHCDLAGEHGTLFPGRPLHSISAAHPSLGRQRIRRTITFQSCIPYLERGWENICWAMNYILLLYLHYLASHESQLDNNRPQNWTSSLKKYETSSPITGILLKYKFVFGLGFLSFVVQICSLAVALRSLGFIPLYLFFKFNLHDFEIFLKVRRREVPDIATIACSVMQSFHIALKLSKNHLNSLSSSYRTWLKVWVRFQREQKVRQTLCH